ncbi:MAG: hypothetical protein ACF8XB_23370 [Planctomycetota bacterium JB042]
MSSDIKKKMNDELSKWRTRLDELRVKANLGKLEAREKLEEFEEAYERAANRLREWKEKGEVEWDATTSALEAGWEKLRQTYHEVKRTGKGD